MNRAEEREDQIVVALRAAPLDRVRLMKTLFIVWYRAGQPDEGPFQFEPYLYGPCAFDLYRTLERMESHGLIIRAPHAIMRWAPYHLTEAGHRLTDMATRRLGPHLSRDIGETARWAAQLSFRRLLDKVYDEAPEFARRSVLRPAGVTR